MTKTKQILVALLLWSMLGKLQADESPQSIKIVLADWTSQILLSEIIGQILIRTGFPIEYATVGTDAQWALLRSNEVQVQMEVWEGTMGPMFDRLVESGYLIDAGRYTATTREEWWYPKYVENLCPGLPDWKALKACSVIFSSPETNPRGLALTGPWNKTEQEKMLALGLNFEVLVLKNDVELFARLKTAFEAKKPILLLNWTPNFTHQVYPGEFVEFPAYEPDCKVRPEWGINKTLKYDCGNPKDGWLKKAVAPNVPRIWPCAFQIIKNFDVDNQLINELTKQVDFDRTPAKRVAISWVNSNRAIWEKWVPEECVKTVP